MKICTKCKKEKPLTDFHKTGKESQCKICAKERAYRYLYPNPGAVWGNKSSAARRATQAKYREKNRERIRQKQREWVKNNLPKVLARTHKYQAAKKKATPPWLNKKHLAQIEAIFIEAARLTKETGVPHEVDHIMPLCGKNLCGLHVPWNLQILPRHENRRKHNKILEIKDKEP